MSYPLLPRPSGLTVPALAGTVCICLSLWGHSAIVAQQHDLLRKSVQVEALRARADQRADVLAAAQALDRLARQWERRRSFTHDELGFEAGLEVTSHAYLDAIQWVDLSGVVRWAVPEEWHHKVASKDFSKDPARSETIERARASGQAALTPAVELASGGQGFVLVRPVTNSAGLAGFLAGVMRFRSLVGGTLDEKFSANYSITILERGRRIYPPVETPPVAPELVHEVELSVLGRSWRLRVAPTAAALDSSRSPLPQVTLGAGLVVSMLLAAILHLARTSRVRATAMEALCEELVATSSRGRQLELERERFFALSTDVLCVVTVAGEIRHMNPAGERLFGTTLGGPGSLWAQANPVDGDPIAFASAQARDGSPVAFEGRVRTADGSEHWLQWRLTVAPAEGLCFGVARDVSDRKSNEALLARHVEELARSNSELEQFAYVASHDLKEPLRMVSLYADLIAGELGEKLDERARRHLGFVVEGANRMESLIEDLLALARLDGRYEPQAIPLGRVVSRAERNLAAALTEAGAVVEHGPLPVVMGHEPVLVQLFQNLLANSVRFRSEAPPRIAIGAERSATGAWRISVTDNGIGIDPQHHARVFQVFERLHARARYPGNGIGLALCRKIVLLHGGRIWVESTKGSGATFRFDLPGAPGEKS